MQSHSTTDPDDREIEELIANMEAAAAAEKEAEPPPVGDAERVGQSRAGSLPRADVWPSQQPHGKTVGKADIAPMLPYNSDAERAVLGAVLLSTK
jgi:hypothetical protein